VLQCVAVCCKCVAVCCSVLQCVAVCCKCVAVCCSVLQCVAVPLSTVIMALVPNMFKTLLLVSFHICKALLYVSFVDFF